MVSPWIFLLLKLVILIILYGFIYKLVKLILSDIKARTNSVDYGEEATPHLFKAGHAALLVVKSSIEDLRPGMKFVLKNNISIGRNFDNSIRINDSVVSHEHAHIFIKGGQFYIEDLGSKNGTVINGTKIKGPVSLSEGDQVLVGGVAFKLVRWENASS